MPIYEYGCPNCKNIFEQMRPFSASSEPAPCPKCGTMSERVVSVFASKAEYKILVPEKEPFRGPVKQD